MIFVKLAILLFALWFVIGKIVASNISPQEQALHNLGVSYKLTFGRAVLAILSIALFVDAFVALVWFLFFR